MLDTTVHRWRAELAAAGFEVASSQVTKVEFVQTMKELNERFERGFDCLEKRLSEASRRPPSDEFSNRPRPNNTMHGAQKRISTVSG